MALPTGTSNPDKRPISPFDLAQDIARELRSRGALNGYAGNVAQDVIEAMIAAALKNGGIRP